MAETSRRWSPYCYAIDNPMRFIDPDGMDWLDKVLGTAVAVVDNATGLNLRDSYTPTDASDYNTGQDAGDLASVAWGLGEADAGSGIAAGSVAATVGTGGLAIEVTAPAFVAGSAMTVHGAYMSASGASNFASQKGRVSNPNGSKGNPDHQQKVNELGKKAQSEVKEGETVLQERKVQGHDSNRRPDQQIVGKDGKTRKTFEAERKPNSSRNVTREEEYKKLGVENETHKVGN